MWASFSVSCRVRSFAPSVFHFRDPLLSPPQSIVGGEKFDMTAALPFSPEFILN